MNTSDPNNASSHKDGTIANQNVERLLTKAYRPEVLDGEFVQRVHERVQAEAQRNRAGVDKSSLRGKTWDMRRSRAWLFVVPCGVVLVLLVMAAYLAIHRGSKASHYRDGKFVWIDGRPYLPAESDAQHRVSVPALAGSQSSGHRNVEHPLRIGAQGLTPRERPVAAQTPSIVGDWIVTHVGERRRVVLPDSSILFVNENATVQIDDIRQITVQKGEIFLEVSPRDAAQDGATFVVKTPRRDVTALGTKFSVSVSGTGTGVLVSQGKVKVTGVDSTIAAGQQLEPASRDTPIITAVPRTSHVLHWTKDLMAAAESPLVPDSEHGGGALVAVDPNGQQTKLSLRKFHVDVHIEDGFARTTIDQTYFNHESQRLEGTFYFPLPPDASISRLAMYVSGRLMEGGMVERDRARDVYETIKYRSLDPALLEWVDGSTFKMRVFPLEGRREKRIILSYTQKLDNNYGRTQYCFPAGHNLDTVRDWSVKVNVAKGAAQSWSCATHELEAVASDRNLVLTAAAHNIQPRRDIVINLFDDTATVHQTTEQSRFSTVQHEGASYVMLRFRPHFATSSSRQRRDWIFLIDVDGSRDPLLARVQVDIVRTLLENAESDDTFSIVAAGTRMNAFAAKQQPITHENTSAAIGFLEKTHLIGALDLEKSLAATENYVRTVSRPILVHVGSGTPILGERRTDKLLEKLPQGVPYVGVAVGKRWNRSFMKSAASRTGGYFTQINPDEPTRWRAFELMSTLNTPRLLDVRVEANSEQGEFFTLKDAVAHGEEICAIARLDPHRANLESVTISGSIDGQPYRRTIPVTAMESEAGYLPRMWAKLAIDDMVVRGADANKSEIIALSKSMYVMSPFTSLLVLENEQMYQEYNVDRGRKDHWALYECPERIEEVYEPLPARQGPKSDVATEADRGKPTRRAPADVLRTLLVRIPIRGTVRLEGGVTRLRGEFDTRGVPGLKKLPYVNRLFNSTGIGDANAMLMVTPRIIIQEEDEGLLGIRFPDPLITELFAFHDRRVLDADGDGIAHGRATMADFDSLIDLITSTIAPDVWIDAGGTGAIEPFPTNLSLVVSQTQYVHDQLLTTNFPVGDLVLPPNKFGRSLHAVESSALPFADEPPIAYPDARAWEELTRSRKRFESVDLAGIPHGLLVAELDPGLNDPRYFDQRVQILTGRLAKDREAPNLLYHEPPAFDHRRTFSNLIAFVPGINTSHADALATLDEEAELENRPTSGEIDVRARGLIDAARREGWQRVTLRDRAQRVMLQVNVDGRGRFRYERTTEHGLHETVVCDGETLRHLYPELGLGTTRGMSRFHRAELTTLVPWLLPPAEDLAVGADLRLIGPRTIAICPHGLDEARDQDGKPSRHVRVHLVFGTEGRLVERRLVEMPTGKTIGRVTYGGSGEVQWFGGNDNQRGALQLTVETTNQPDLAPNVDDLVVLPMPLRDRDHIYQMVQRAESSVGELPSKANALQVIANDAKRTHGDDPSFWTEHDVLQLIAASHWQNPQEMRKVIARRFFAKGDRRLGFYTLLVSSGERWDVQQVVPLGDGTSIGMNPLADHPESPLARYIDSELHEVRNDASTAPAVIDDLKNRFIRQLSGYRFLDAQWSHDGGLSSDAEVRRQELDAVFDFISRSDSPTFANLLLRRVQRRCGDSQPHGRIAEVLIELEKKGIVSYVVKYELARSLASSGDKKQAKRLFVQLYRETLELDLLPPIDRAFSDLLGNGNVADPFAEADDTERGFDGLMREACARLIEQRRRPSAIVLAWQCRQLGYSRLADSLFDLTLVAVPDNQQLETTLAAVDYLVHAEGHDRADNLFQRLLASPSYSQLPSLWRLAAQISHSGRRLARSLVYLEKAMDLEYENLPAKYNVEPVRADFDQLLTRYEELAKTVAAPGADVPLDLIERTVRAADRWRSMDTDVTAACDKAARVLTALRQEELAWDYLTTPLALKPNEASPWLSLAETLRSNEDIELSDRAYTAAFEAEPTNAQILWDHAQLLAQGGREMEARRLYTQLASGQWQPRFNWIKQQAERLKAPAE